MTSTVETPLLKIPEVAKALNVSRATVYRWTAEPDCTLKFVRMGKSVRVHPDDLAAFIESKRA